MGSFGIAYVNCRGEAMGSFTPVDSNILTQFDFESPVAIVGISVVCLTLLLTLQLVLPFCRESCFRFYACIMENPPPIQNKFEVSNELWVEAPGTMESDAHRQGSHLPLGETPTFSRRIFIGITLALYVSQLLLACVVPSVKIVWDIFGGTFATIICYTVPAAAYLALTASAEIAPRKTSRRALATAMFYTSFALCAVCTASTFYGLALDAGPKGH